MLIAGLGSFDYRLAAEEDLAYSLEFDQKIPLASELLEVSVASFDHLGPLALVLVGVEFAFLLLLKRILDLGSVLDLQHRLAFVGPVVVGLGAPEIELAFSLAVEAVA